MALRWTKNPRPTGLMRVGAGPQGHTLRDGETEYARVSALRKNHEVQGWYWVALSTEAVPYRNTCNEPVADEATAKRDAMTYVKAWIKMRGAA